jgi:hypothetical protein
MQKVPQIVRERLKAGTVVTGHPDAEILSAFAERSLLEPDRATILTHLATCADCREILALALPATEEFAAASLKLRHSWLTWPAFRWGFATAGVAVIALGLVEFEHHRPAHSATVARQVAPAAISAEMKKAVAPTLAPEQNALEKSAGIAKKNVSQIAEARLRHVPVGSRAHTPERLQAAAPALVARQQAPNPPASASQMVEVQVQRAPLNAQTADAQIAKASPANGSAEQFFSNSLPLTRAKPADIEPLQTGSAGAMMATPRWSITAVGGLQRSLDQGKTWQDIDVNGSALPSQSVAAGAMSGPMKAANVQQKSMAAPSAGKVSVTPIFFRTVTAAGSEVWAGGSDAALFHSIDGGNHWTRVLPSSSDAVLTGDVLSVEFSDPQHGSVTTSTPEIWTTTDGGQTWQKQ